MNSIQNALLNKNIGYAKKGVIIGAIAGMLWGLGGIIISVAFSKDPFLSFSNLSLYIVPLVGACLTDSISGISTLIMNIVGGKAKEYTRVVKTKPGKFIIIASIFGGPMAMSGYYIGLYLAGPFYTMAITALYPAVGAILSRIFLKEKISRNAWLGIFLCIIGAIIVSYVVPTGTYPHFYLGITACFLATIGWGLEGVICAYGMDLVDPNIAIGIRWFTSFIVYFIAVLPFVAGIGLSGYALFFTAFSSSTILILIAAAVVNAVSYFWYYKSINMSGVSRALALMITYALWGIIFGWIITGSANITFNIVIGAIIIVAGALLVAGKPSDLIKIRDN